MPKSPSIPNSYRPLCFKKACSAIFEVLPNWPSSLTASRIVSPGRTSARYIRLIRRGVKNEYWSFRPPSVRRKCSICQRQVPSSRTVYLSRSPGANTTREFFVKIIACDRSECGVKYSSPPLM
eukprot:5597018-Prymnesium_polylepis.3